MEGIFIDNCVWHFLHARQIDLAQEFPKEQYQLCITREAEFEYPPIPDPLLLSYVRRSIEQLDIKTDVYFGFADMNDSLPPEEYRIGGLDQGRWCSPEELAFFDRQRHRRNNNKRKTKLYKHEADISLAARSFIAVVLTRDTKGALKDAKADGGRVIDLNDFDQSGLTLRQYVESRL